MQPQNADIRNHLLMLAPEKWNEKLRSAAAITVTRGEDLLAATSKPGGPTRLEAVGSPSATTTDPKTGEHWLSKVRAKAESALKVRHI
jgi:hypothetical protein